MDNATFYEKAKKHSKLINPFNDGKTYKAVPSFTDGVLSWTAEEVV